MLNQIKKVLLTSFDLKSTISGKKSDRDLSLIYIATDKKTVAFVNIGAFNKTVAEFPSYTDYLKACYSACDQLSKELSEIGLTLFSAVEFHTDINGKAFPIRYLGQVGVDLTAA